ncbi:hypothetical protein Glove_301g3 [Diversispora epigaea]|uniref:DNA 3'-5' helicase n=1 Tax=Diversispora epigaea TaxID=1348612 RepID=A0A397HVY6_9GLOM|nr:hypothetical protein Glove_301g3 [Diversispora epigaea]
MHNILKFVQERSQQVIRNRDTIQLQNEERKIKFANEKKELIGFDFDKELVSYKSKTIDQIRENIFWPSFGDLLIDFDVIVKCIVCHAFAKKSSRGLCEVCSFYVDADGQKESIMAYLNGNDIFVSMKTGRGKTLCYILSAICSKGLTIVYSPLKALMEDQKRELIKAGIPCATLYTNLAQGTSVQEKIFEEIACGKAWGQLGMLKQRWKLALIMLLTATCTRSEVDEICENLSIDKNNTGRMEKNRTEFPIYEFSQIGSWGQLGMLKQRWKLALIMLLTATCTRSEVDEICENLSIDKNNTGYFHGGLRDDERKTTMNNWKTNSIQIIIATSAFGMGINFNDVRAVIHTGAPMSIMNLIQEAGRAGHDGNTAIHIIFYNKKDILLYYCNSQYECCQQLIWKYQAWPNEESPPICEKCDNCVNRIAKKPKLIDGKEEIIKLLEVVEFLTQQRDEQIGLDDIIDVFRGGKTAKVKQKKWDTLPVYPTEKRKVLKTKELVSFALLDLVVRGLVQEKIILRRPNEGNLGLSSSIIVVGIVQGVQANVNMHTWQYFVK